MSVTESRTFGQDYEFPSNKCMFLLNDKSHKISVIFFKEQSYWLNQKWVHFQYYNSQTFLSSQRNNCDGITVSVTESHM